MKESDFKYSGHRNSYTELNEIYFWTITINKWQQLLKPEEHKMIIINSLRWLVEKNLVKIYGYVIMQNPRLTGRAGYSFNVGTIINEWQRVS